MIKFSKSAQVTLGAAALVAGLTSAAFAECEVSGNQTIPPYKTDTFSMQPQAYSGSERTTAFQCLLDGLNNEEIQRRDITDIHMQWAGRAGSFTLKGSADQIVGPELSDSQRPKTSIAWGEAHGSTTNVKDGTIFVVYYDSASGGRAEMKEFPSRNGAQAAFPGLNFNN